MKNTARMAALTASILLCGLSIPLFAQAPPSGPCPPGAVPIPGQGRCGSPAEASANRGVGSSRPVSAEVWENRFGAVARGYGEGFSGAVEGAKSEREARKIALSRCTETKCKIVSLVRNGCQAVASSDDGSGYGRAENKQDAINMALQNCLKRGGQCDIGYSDCSLPVRVK
jgi:hypothetical protein